MPINTGDNNFGVAALIVDPTLGSGTHTTIGAALTAATSGQTIFIRPGTYTENLTLKAGVNLTAFDCDALTPNVIILGKCTATYTGTVTMSGINLQTNTDFVIQSTGSNSATLNLFYCLITCSNNTGINSANTNFVCNLTCCTGTKGSTLVSLTSISAGQVILRFCDISNFPGSTTPEAISGGFLQGRHSQIGNGCLCTGTGAVNLRWCDMNAPSGMIPLNSSSSGISVLYFCNLTANGGVASINVTGSGQVRLFGGNDTESTATNAISGTGPIVYDAFTTGNVNGTIAGTITTTARTLLTGTINLSNNLNIMSGSGSPNGLVTAPQGSLYLRTDGSNGTNRAFINTNGGTSWTAINTVA